MTTHTDMLDRVTIHAERSRVAAHDGRPPLAHRERILLQLRDNAEAPVVATTGALHHRSSLDGPGGWRRLGWADTGRVRFDADAGLLELTALGSGPAHRLGVAGRAGARLAAMIRERVAATVLATSRVPLDHGTSALVTARRRPDTAEIIWVVLLPGGADPTDPVTQARTDAAIRELCVTTLR
jgi:hypothetical protein